MKKNILTIILVLSTISLCLNTQKAIGVNIFKKNLVDILL